MTDKQRTFIDKAFKDTEGKWALAAAPNLPILTWFIALLISFLVHGTLHILLATLQQGALFVWAWLELFQGVNYFRRSLGFVVLVYILWSAAHHHILL